MMSQEPENLFNDEIAQLWDNLTDRETDQSGQDAMEELVSLLEEISSSELQNPKLEHSSLSSLPSEAEIENLFQDSNWNWEEDGGAANQTDWDELESLLEETEPVGISWYESIEQLENLIDRTSEPLTREPAQSEVFEQLEALIETSMLPAAKAREIPVSMAMAGEETLDDEFRELEKFLEQTSQAMGGSSTVLAATNQRLQRPAKIFEQTLKIPVKQLNNLSNLIGELVVQRNRLEEDQERLRGFLDKLLAQVQNLNNLGDRMKELYERTLLERALLASRRRGRGTREEEGRHNFSQTNEGRNPYRLDHNFHFEELDRFTELDPLTVEMIELIVRVREAASDIQFVVDESEQVARVLTQVTTQLQEGMTKSRMISFSQATDRLPRALRDISLKLNKQVQLQVEGGEVLIDKMILEHLNSPITHLVNNAITHGIEVPAQRERAGKPPMGTIKIRAFLQGNQTVIIFSDDGAGIDAQTVKTKAIEKRLITKEEASFMTDQEVYELLFHPGFTTKDKADDFCGRGFGLDVVRTSLAEVRGTATIDSVLGKGTIFTIRLPLTLSICKALCCLNNHARLAFSMDGVERIMKDFSPQELKVNAEGQTCIPWYNNLLPLYPLGDLLHYNPQVSRSSVYGGKQEGDKIAVIVLHSGNNLLAVQVEQVLGEQEIVIKQIDGPVPKPLGIAGATVLGDGSVIPIGDVLELIEISQGRLRIDRSSPWRKSSTPDLSSKSSKSEPTVLIADDSITVRELLSLSFSKAGYRVEQARDGQEAWEKLCSGLPCDILFCDIEMPRMNGLELLDQLQKDEQLCKLPVALLTSRGAERHRKVASKLGACGYFTKPYTEKDLLDAAARMIAGEILLPNSSKLEQKPAPEMASSPSKPPIESNYANFDRHQPSAPPPIPSLVLIIDDSVMVREMLSMSFKKAGYQVEQARDGQEAWEKLQGGLACHLILCDIEMPRMNGLELLYRLREDPQLATIPVAMITSRAAQKMQKKAAEMGAKGYFVKPYIEEVLLDAAQRLIAGENLL